MRSLTGREYLRRLLALDKLLKSLENDLLRTRSDVISLQATDYSRDKIQTGVPFDISDKIIQIERQSQLINDKLDEFIKLRDEARKLIHFVEDFMERSILIERYLCCKTMEQIGNDIGYSTRWIVKRHREALVSFDKIYKQQNCSY